MNIQFKKNIPFFEGVSIKDITQSCSTPFYLYSQKIIKETYDDLKSALSSEIFYAIKANSNQAILRLIKNCGAGADVVSAGELQRAIHAGFDLSKIIFEGVGKSKEDIEYVDSIVDDVRWLGFDCSKQDKIMEDVGGKPHVISLQYANTEDIVKLLSNITNQITVEKSGNNLLINASPKKLAEIEYIIDQIDVPATQIVLEARLIEVSMGDEKSIGLDWAKLGGISFKLAEAGAPVDLGTKFSKTLIPGLTFTQNELGLYEESYEEVMRAILPQEMYYQRIFDPDQESPLKGLLPFGYGVARQLTAFDLALDFLLKDNGSP